MARGDTGRTIWGLCCSLSRRDNFFDCKEEFGRFSGLRAEQKGVVS
jgi:hypothetical protein